MKPAVEWISRPSRPRTRLPLQPGDEVVGSLHPLERRAEHELAGVEDERLVVDLDELGQVLLRLLDVDERVARVAEDAEVAVDAHVDARRLEERGVVRVDLDPALVEQRAGSSGRRGPRGDSTRLAAGPASAYRWHDRGRDALDRASRPSVPGPALRGDPRAQASASSPARSALTFPIVAAEARGATLTDVDGNTFIDFTGGVGCLNVGHSHPRVVAAAQEQLDALRAHRLHDRPVRALRRARRAAARARRRSRARRRPRSSTPAPRRSRTRSSSRARTRSGRR